MATVADIVKRSMILIGVLESGETPTADEAATGLNHLNDILAELSQDNLLIYGNTLESFTLTGNKNTYTFGTGGDFNSARPERINSMFIRSGNTDYPLSRISRDAYLALSAKSSTSDIPEVFAFEADYATANVYLYPTPVSAATLWVDSEKLIATYTATTDTVALPEPYLLLLRLMLADSLAGEYGVQIPATQYERLVRLRKIIKRNNQQPMRVDLGLSQRSGYNILGDTSY